MTGVIEDIEDGIRALETEDTDPLRIAEDALPLYVDIEQLRQLGEAQAQDFEQLASTFDKAREEAKSISADLRPNLVVERRRSIKEEAMERGREIHRKMIERAKMATLTREFYEPNSIRQRAVLDDPKRASELVTVLAAAPPVALLGYSRLASGLRDTLLAAVTLQAVQARAAEVPDSIAHGAKTVIGNMPLPESEQGRGLIISLIGAEQDAQRAIRAYHASRVDATGKIARGLRERGD